MQSTRSDNEEGIMDIKNVIEEGIMDIKLMNFPITRSDNEKD